MGLEYKATLVLMTVLRNVKRLITERGIKLRRR